MLVRRVNASFQHFHFHDLPDLVNREDLFVLNNTRVFAARLFGHRAGHEKERIEILLLEEFAPQVWDVLAKPGRKLKPGTRLIFQPETFEARVVEIMGEGPRRRLEFQVEGDFWSLVELFGRVPLPPYIDRPSGELDELDRKRYQTVYARHRGSVAAPTAGLHFTRSLLDRVNFCEVTLHVGYGTFKPVSTPTIEEHVMDRERYHISAEAASQIRRQRAKGARVIAVGTTTTRLLESVARAADFSGEQEGSTDLFIRPGFNFQVVEGLVTNFHLPRSTLLLLVSAFAGADLIKAAYQEAIRKRYRFYSYGDAMLIL